MGGGKSLNWYNDYTVEDSNDTAVSTLPIS